MVIWCVECDDPINGGQRWETTAAGPVHSSCAAAAAAGNQVESAGIGSPLRRAWVPFPKRADGAYGQRLEREAFEYLGQRGWQVVREAVELDELRLTVPRRKRNGLAAAVVRELWRERWSSISKELGYGHQSAAIRAARDACAAAGNATQIVYLVVRQCVLDEYLSDRALIVEELEMQTEIGHVTCFENSGGGRSYQWAGPRPPDISGV